MKNKSRRMVDSILVGLSLLVLSACGQTTMVRNVNNSDYMLPNGSVEVQLLETEMWAYAGIKETKAIKSGHFSVFKARFPMDLFKEIFPGRAVWYGWVVNRRTKKEFFVQLLFSGFEENDDPFVNIIIDGDESTGMIPEECSFIGLSTKFNRAYDIGGTMHQVDAGTFSKSPEYRLRKVIEYGDEVGDLKVIANGKGLIKDILINWSYYQRKSDGVKFYTPLTEAQMKQLAKLNPQYDFWNKYKYNAKLLVTPNYVAVVISGTFDIVISANAPSWGADFDSVIKRGDMGLALEFVHALHKKNSERVAQLMFEQLVAEMGTTQVPFKVLDIKLEKEVTVKIIDTRVVSKPVTIPATVSSRIWRDYTVDGITGEEIALDQMIPSLNMLGIYGDVATIFKHLALHRQGRLNLLRSGDRLKGVVMNKKIIHQDVTVEWNKGMSPLAVTKYRLSDNKNPKIRYSIGQTSYGHWIRFETGGEKW